VVEKVALQLAGPGQTVLDAEGRFGAVTGLIFRPQVEPHHIAVRNELGNHRHDAAASAAHVQHLFIAAERQPAKNVRPHLELSAAGGMQVHREPSEQDQTRGHLQTRQASATAALMERRQTPQQNSARARRQ
jgi:hypothetical protein